MFCEPCFKVEENLNIILNQAFSSERKIVHLAGDRNRKKQLVFLAAHL